MSDDELEWKSPLLSGLNLFSVPTLVSVTLRQAQSDIAIVARRAWTTVLRHQGSPFDKLRVTPRQS